MWLHAQDRGHAQSTDSMLAEISDDIDISRSHRYGFIDRSSQVTARYHHCKTVPNLFLDGGLGLAPTAHQVTFSVV